MSLTVLIQPDIMILSAGADRRVNPENMGERKMPTNILIDPLAFDTTKIVYDMENIRQHNKQRHEFEMLSGILHWDKEQQLAVGFKKLSGEDFWVRGHIPGRPLFPGVMQIEAAGQLTSWAYMELMGNPPGTFLGFMGVTDVKFRGMVTPEDTYIMAAKAMEIRPRRIQFITQGFVKDKLVFEGTIVGAPM